MGSERREASRPWEVRMVSTGFAGPEVTTGCVRPGGVR